MIFIPPFLRKETLDADRRNRESATRALCRLEVVDCVLRWFRVCAGCTSIWPPIDLFCENCWGRLLQFENVGEDLLQKDYPFPVYSLFTWTPLNDFLLRALIRAFKGGWANRTARDLVERFCGERVRYCAVDAPVFFHPPSSTRDRDHAWLLAQSFSRTWATEPARVFRVLGESVPGAQKTRSASERSRRRFHREEIFSGSSRTFVFIDDVITTGATGMAAYMALGDPDHFEAWTLVCRPKLAGKKRI